MTLAVLDLMHATALIEMKEKWREAYAMLLQLKDSVTKATTRLSSSTSAKEKAKQKEITKKQKDQRSREARAGADQEEGKRVRGEGGGAEEGGTTAAQTGCRRVRRPRGHVERHH